MNGKRFAAAMGTAAGVVILVGLPLLGAWLAGMPLGQYLEFPPTTRYVEHAASSWPVFLGLALAILCVLLPLLHRWLRASVALTEPDPAGSRSAFRVPRSAFPWWGWLALVFGALAWLLAWTRFEWVAPLQPFTFTPLWLAYIAVVNALTFRRSGHCMLTDRPRHLARLFAVSSAFWWFFEYLNRFVQNWYYTGIGGLAPWKYFVFATLPFSTVLPAVLGTCELLATFPRMAAGLDRFRPLTFPRPRRLAALTFAAAAAGLAAIGVWPDLLFPLLWLAPVLILTSVQSLRGQTTVLTEAGRGDWRRVWLLAMAALICGFFWEMWNFLSLAKWIYAVPYVHRFRLFEMPILGYAGYLPFGLECAVVAGLAGHETSRNP